MEKITSERLKQIQLSILDDIHSFCTENGLNYSLCGGTLLGAVRHKGYIPWDDDIDLMMPREDYERFIRTYTSDENYLLDLRESDVTVELCVKVCRKNTSLVDKTLKRNLWGVNVDIFPIDGAPDNFAPFCEDILWDRNTLSHICPFYKVVSRKKLKWLAKYFIKRVLFPYSGNVVQLKYAIHEKASATGLGNDGLGGVILGSYGDREVVPSCVFADYTLYEFEGKQYRGIRDSHAYLSAIYGDYMKLPPPEKRISHHLYDAFED